MEKSICVWHIRPFISLFLREIVLLMHEIEKVRTGFICALDVVITFLRVPVTVYLLCTV